MYARRAVSVGLLNNALEEEFQAFPNTGTLPYILPMTMVSDKIILHHPTTHHPSPHSLSPPRTTLLEDTDSASGDTAEPVYIQFCRRSVLPRLTTCSCCTEAARKRKFTVEWKLSRPPHTPPESARIATSIAGGWLKARRGTVMRGPLRIDSCSRVVKKLTCRFYYLQNKGSAT